ncbi:hypothetical protein FOVSG1_006919 [Fusarium oxysporum f. sp. vasinfectum]
MKLQLSSLQLVASAVLLPASQAFSVTTTNDANALASAIFGQGITILQASFSGATISSGTFTDGPFGIGSGGILTSGAAVGALPNGDHYVNNGAPGSDTYCNTNTFNAAILTVDFFLNPTYSGVRVELILASEEEGGSADPIGIFVGGTQYALDSNGNRITAISPYLAQPIGITPPDSVTSYPGSSPPFWVDILTSGAQTMVIAICDQSDSEWDSALLINAEGCIDCDTDVRLAYVTTTTTLPSGEAPFTSTTKASGTVSGTIRIGVTADETTTTTAEPTTNTTQDFSTTTEEPTATTQETTPTETSAEASSTVTSSEELPNTTTTTIMTTDTTKESSIISIESTSDIITTTSLDPSTQSKTDTETIRTTSTETISTSGTPIDGTTTSSGDIKTSIISSAVSASTDEPTESLSSDISTQDTAIPNPDITTTAESPKDTTVQQTEPSTDYQQPQTVEMTTIKVDCNACGHYGENTIILDVPASAVVVAPTDDHSIHESHQVQYYEPNPYGQKPRPDESDPHIWQKPRPQNTSPAAGNEIHDGEGGHKFDQPQAYQGGPTGTIGSHGQGEPAVVTKTEPKPTPARSGFYTGGA